MEMRVRLSACAMRARVLPPRKSAHLPCALDARWIVDRHQPVAGIKSLYCHKDRGGSPSGNLNARWIGLKVAVISFVFTATPFLPAFAAITDCLYPEFCAPPPAWPQQQQLPPLTAFSRLLPPLSLTNSTDRCAHGPKARLGRNCVPLLNF